MAGNDDQAQLGMVGQQLTIYAQHEFLLARSSGTADPDRAASRVESHFRREGLVARLTIGQRSTVELHCADHAYAVRRRSEPDESVGVAFFLRTD